LRTDEWRHAEEQGTDERVRAFVILTEHVDEAAAVLKLRKRQRSGEVGTGFAVPAE
jgi:hypothetical protein